MRLYLDDDLVSRHLVALLQNARHDVQLPADVALAGGKDPVHLAHAVRQQRVCLTRNYDDYRVLHELVRAVGGHHPGILVVREEQDRKRNMKVHEIVRAIHNLEAANYVLADQYEVLNHWC